MKILNLLFFSLWKEQRLTNGVHTEGQAVYTLWIPRKPVNGEQMLNHSDIRVSVV